MKKRSLLVLLLLGSVFVELCSANKKTSRTQTVKNEEDALHWLNRYGYNPCLNTEVQCSLSFTSTIKDYQERFKLKVTGKLDENTKNHMNRPRCGVQDKAPSKLQSSAALPLVAKWSRIALNYSLRGFPTELSNSKTATIIREAFDAWLGHIPMKIDSTCPSCKSDFVVDFERQTHSDSYPFDGVGGTLAHAFFPEDGRIHFDKDEKWTESFDGTNTNLYVVAVHEIGHALGLDHTYNEKSIMYPSYQLMQKSQILPEPDRLSIQKLYGIKREETKTTTSTSKTTTQAASIPTKSSTSSTTNEKSHPRCRLFLDAAFEHPDGTFHTFNAGVLWRYLIKEKKWDSKASSYKSIYYNLPSMVSAAAFDKRANRAIFFTSTQAYYYDFDSKLRATTVTSLTLPRNLQNSIVGALYYQGEIHVLTSKTIRQFRIGTFASNSHENELLDEFTGFDENLITAFSRANLHYFFTQGHLVSVWDENLRSWTVRRKPMDSNWFACPPVSKITLKKLLQRV